MDKRLLIKAYHLKNVEHFLKLKEKTQRCQQKLGQNLVCHTAIFDNGFLAFLILSKLPAVSYIWLFCLIGLGGCGYIQHLMVLHCFLFKQSMQKNKLTSEEYSFMSELAYFKEIGCQSFYWQKRINKKQKINFSRYFDELLSCKKLIANHRVKLSFPQKNLIALSCFFDFLLALLGKIIRSGRLGEMLKPHAYGLVFVRELKLIVAELKKPKQINLAGRSLFLIQRLILELIEQRLNLACALETISLRLKNTGIKSLDRHGFSSWERWPRFGKKGSLNLKGFQIIFLKRKPNYKSN